MGDRGTGTENRDNPRGINSRTDGEFTSGRDLKNLDARDIGEGGIIRGTRSDDEGVGTHSSGKRRAREIITIEKDPIAEGTSDDVVGSGRSGSIHHESLGEGVVTLKGLGDFGLSVGTTQQGLGNDLAG